MRVFALYRHKILIIFLVFIPRTDLFAYLRYTFYFMLTTKPKMYA